MTTTGVAAMTARSAPNHPFFSGLNSGITVIAHRGGANLRPENTLVAFEHAVSIGADVLEMDLRATADGSIVVLHDATVDRTTDGQGRVDALTLAELQKLDAGYRWTSDGGMVGLGMLPGHVYSEARGVSGDGSVVVGISDSDDNVGGAEAFRWTSGGMERLWDVLVAHGVDPAANGWTSLGYVSAISADGSTTQG